MKLLTLERITDPVVSGETAKNWTVRVCNTRRMLSPGGMEKSMTACT